MIKVAPSILSANFAKMGEDVQMLNESGADWIHFDVMDGHFVPNITFGPGMCAAVRPLTTLPLDVHLMVSDPAFWVEPFHQAGADWLSIHAETDKNAVQTLEKIRSLGMKAGIVLNPATPVDLAEPLLPYCDLVLLMSVNPGFGGQAFMPFVLEKIKALRSMVDALRLPIEIEVDGGINPETAMLCREAGASVLVAGNAVFSAENPADMIRRLRG